MDEYLFPVTVFVDDDPQWSGLLDPFGNPIFYSKRPVGFDIEYLRRQNQAQSPPQGPYRKGPSDPQVPRASGAKEES